uniref:Predicted UDP-N-acetylmuramate:L-alanyl-gamma-D-glutamyl-meso-diaminopimelate ligase n=1 Tax=uncultured bacterium MedeBAC35C06 TaxID=332273 RepID=Q4PK98_9BACT|nr:predicted UDP-N-acetylmuramate:L-alanyl-gamma-D-glutamyl-meso- diaminopimelate ligase [uncultured bacterium MedeBAC35C06]
MKVHILGICGTFMAGVAKLMIEKGYEVSGSDKDFYPPMSEYLETLKIDLIKGYDSQNLPEADLYVIGNVISRGNESFEKILSNKLPYTSGPKIIADLTKEENLIAVTGTHGKTTTSYMLCHIFIENGIDIGYLVGGISPHFQDSAKIGTANIFIIEGDEYDSALFDKRSKFINYNPHSIIINNIEFDHADIFRDIDDIKRQFHHLVKIIPNDGSIMYHHDDPNIKDVINLGSWSKMLPIGEEDLFYSYENREMTFNKINYSLTALPLKGIHNFKNYVAAIYMAYQYGVPIKKSIQALSNFSGVKRRQELVYDKNNISIIDDFAHHPTAIKLTIESIKHENPKKNIIGIIELGSNTMASGKHIDLLINAANDLDSIYWYDPRHALKDKLFKKTFNSLDDLHKDLLAKIQTDSIILIMTNKNSSHIYQPIREYLEG